jgi:hypothetical protein
MTDIIEKIEEFCKLGMRLSSMAGMEIIYNYIQALKAEKEAAEANWMSEKAALNAVVKESLTTEPTVKENLTVDKGEMAYEMLMEFRNCAYGKDWGKDLMRMIDFVQAKYKETK